MLSEPIRAASHDASTHTLIFVVDALDECSDPNMTEEILRLLLEHSPNLRVKFFVTSRPESHIEDVLSTEYPESLHLHKVDTKQVNKDIELYVQTKLTDLTRNRPQLRALVDWPSRAQIHTLTFRAEGLFIYVFTALQYISDRRGNPERRLNDLTRPTTSVSPSWIRDIDEMYSFILNEALVPLDPFSVEYSNVLHCLSAIIGVTENLSVPTLASLLRLDPSDVRVALAGVHSLVSVPPDDRGHLTTFHASFADYLTNRERSGVKPWFVDDREAHFSLACGCIELMSARMHFNITGAQTSSKFNENQNLETIPDDVSYACRFWHEHVIASTQGSDSHLWARLKTVLESKFLYWVEVMSRLGVVRGSPAKIQKLILKGNVSSILSMHF